MNVVGGSEYGPEASSYDSHPRRIPRETWYVSLKLKSMIGLRAWKNRVMVLYHVVDHSECDGYCLGYGTECSESPSKRTNETSYIRNVDNMLSLCPHPRAERPACPLLGTLGGFVLPPDPTLP